MTTTAYDDQFAECTPEEGALFDEMQARKDEALISEQRAQRAEEYAIEQLAEYFTGGFITMDTSPRDIAKVAYAAIRDGKIPGVEIKRGDV